MVKYNPIFFVLRFAVMLLTLLLVLTKNAPGGDLIRVDLIRFPGSIPGDIIQMCTN